MHPLNKSTTLTYNVLIRSGCHSSCTGGKGCNDASRPPSRQAAGSCEHDGTRTLDADAGVCETMTTAVKRRGCAGITHKESSVAVAEDIRTDSHRESQWQNKMGGADGRTRGEGGRRTDIASTDARDRYRSADARRNLETGMIDRAARHDQTDLAYYGR